MAIGVEKLKDSGNSGVFGLSPTSDGTEGDRAQLACALPGHPPPA
jgi:hypothetical protein